MSKNLLFCVVSSLEVSEIKTKTPCIIRGNFCFLERTCFIRPRYTVTHILKRLSGNLCQTFSANPESSRGQIWEHQVMTSFLVAVLDSKRYLLENHLLNIQILFTAVAMDGFLIVLLGKLTTSTEIITAFEIFGSK